MLKLVEIDCNLLTELQFQDLQVCMWVNLDWNRLLKPIGNLKSIKIDFVLIDINLLPPSLFCLCKSIDFHFYFVPLMMRVSLQFVSSWVQFVLLITVWDWIITCNLVTYHYNFWLFTWNWMWFCEVLINFVTWLLMNDLWMMMNNLWICEFDISANFILSHSMIFFSIINFYLTDAANSSSFKLWWIQMFAKSSSRDLDFWDFDIEVVEHESHRVIWPDWSCSNIILQVLLTQFTENYDLK